MSVLKFFVASACVAALTACSAPETAEVKPEASSAANTPAPKANKPVATVPTSAYGDAPSGVYGLDKTHAYIMFHYDHQGFSKPYLRWRHWDSSLTWDNETPENSSVSVTIETSSIDTGVDIFDEHLRAERWFDVETYPEITFTSTSLTKSSDTQGTMTGDLTIKGITKPVTLDVTFNRAAKGRAPGTVKIGFSASGQIMRSEWGLGGAVPVVSDAVDLMIEVEYGIKIE